MRCTVLLWALGLAGCALRQQPPLPADPPSEAARHRAALATITVVNATTSRLTLAFRSATLPVQEVIIGYAEPGASVRLAPVPAGEPIIMIARRADGAEHRLAARSYPLDDEWTWEIPTDAKFTTPDEER